MKHRGERRMGWGEGWLVAAALGLVLALALVVYVGKLPPKAVSAPVHELDYGALRRVEMVNINTAPVEKLARLPGIGEVLAERIVAHREKYGPFASPQDLLQVEGIGEGKLDGIRNEIYLD